MICDKERIDFAKEDTTITSDIWRKTIEDVLNNYDREKVGEAIELSKVMSLFASLKQRVRRFIVIPVNMRFWPSHPNPRVRYEVESTLLLLSSMINLIGKFKADAYNTLS